MFARQFSRLLVLGSAALAALALPHLLLTWRYSGSIFTVDSPPPPDEGAVAVVFGAGLRRDGGPTRVLADRVATAAALYREGVVSELVLSGTVRGGYDEPRAMSRYAQALGVPQSAVHVDREGSRTIETCRNMRARGFAQVLLVSQRYHLPRALATCAGLGLPAQGVSADLRPYRGEFIWRLREIPATLVALWETHLSPGRPTDTAIRSEALSTHGS